ncbi:MAG: putative basic amino acid antiporter YfcC [Tissierellia bacterium]|nr:putative basic amino acid antiporter YfcC [Tissierellia bacterium]
MTQKKKREFPHTYVIIFVIILIAGISTYVLPAGEYDRVQIEMPDGSSRTVVDPDTFHYVDSNPVPFFNLMQAVPKGLVASAEVVFFIFVVGGAFGIINSTGAILDGIRSLALKFGGKETLMIPVIMTVFSLGGATFGMSEETIVFVPIGIVLARSLGYDAVVGTAIVFSGAAAGFVGGWMNPFTVGVAQGIAELPTFSGIGFRLVLYVAILASAILWTMRYANKVKEDPSYSFCRQLELDQASEVVEIDKDHGLTTRQKLVLVGFVLGMMILVYGVLIHGWYMIEIAALFFTMGLVLGIIGGISPNTMAEEFIAGAKDLATGALVVGFSRGILVVLSEGVILDTIIHGLAGTIQNLPRTVAAVGMFIVQSIMNFFIPSGSGQAGTTMPIMVPLADVIGMTRQTAVVAFQCGDGISNSIIPTGASLLAALGVAKIKYEEWVRFIWPLMVIQSVIAAVFMVIATFMNLGPF